MRGREPAAERAWRIALAAMLAARHLERPVDLQRVLEMAVAQALPGAPQDIRAALDPDNGLHLHALFLELDNAGTSEARLVRALGDLIDGRGGDRHDRFLRDLDRALRLGHGRCAATG